MTVPNTARIEAKNMLSRGQGEATNKQFEIAYQLLSSAVIVDSTFAAAWFALGQANWDLGRREASLACYREALNCPKDGDFSEAMRAKIHCNYGHTAYHLGRVEEALDHEYKALEIDSCLAFAHTNLSMCLSVEGEHDLALQEAQKAFEMDPNSPVVEIALAFALMYKRKWKDGLMHFQARFPYRLPHFANYPYPPWEGEEGKVVFVVSEQGMGDTIAYSRFIRAACKRSRFVHFGIQPELARLMRAVFQDVPNINILPQPCPFPPAEFWSTPMSLPVALKLSDKEIEEEPAIKAPDFAVSSQWKDAHAKLHVGVAWSGSKSTDINHHRSFPVTQLLRLCDVPGVQLYSLQADDASMELHVAGCGALIRDLKPYIRDVADTCAILRELDLVITTESALGHIAGICRKEAWIAYSYLGRSYHVGHGDDHRYLLYPSHFVVKQHEDRDWGPVFGTLAGLLIDKLRKREAA